MAKGAQGIKTKSVTCSKYVITDDFQAGIAEHCAGKPPPVFTTGWRYEHGRQMAAALIARGIDPLKLTPTKQARWLGVFLMNGTLVR